MDNPKPYTEHGCPTRAPQRPASVGQGDHVSFHVFSGEGGKTYVVYRKVLERVPGPETPIKSYALN